MLMHPSPISETTSPCRPSVRVFMGSPLMRRPSRDARMTSVSVCPTWRAGQVRDPWLGQRRDHDAEGRRALSCVDACCAMISRFAMMQEGGAEKNGLSCVAQINERGERG